MNKLVKRLLTGTLAFATILTALPVTAVHASGNQYWTESAERVGYIEQIMNDGSIKSTFHEGHMKVEGETAYCVDINTNFKNGYKTRSDASTRMSSDQIADVALSLEYVKQYTATHTGLNNNQKYLLEQCVVWQRLSEQLGWQCDNVRASYNEISQAVQKKQELQKAQEARQTVHANGSATAGATRSHERPVVTPVPKPAQTDIVTKPDMKRPATSPVIKNAEIKAGKENVRTNIRQEQQVKSVARANQPNVAESISNHKKSTVQKTQVNQKQNRKTVTKRPEKGRKK